MSAIIQNYLRKNTVTPEDIKGMVMPFGKYKGMHVYRVFEDDPQYLRFCWDSARNRLTPQIHKFIKHNIVEIKKAVQAQEREELGLFSDDPFISETNTNDNPIPLKDKFNSDLEINN